MEKCGKFELGVCKECCGDLTACEGCDELVCELCLHTRQCCNRTLCEECQPFVTCDGKCGKAHCEDCFDGKDYKNVSEFEGDTFCLDCFQENVR